MKLFTLILATTVLVATSTASVAQTSFISLKNMVSNDGNSFTTSRSIKFNPDGIAEGILKVKMFNQPDGVYTVQLVDADGKVLATKEIKHISNRTMEIADFGKKFTGGTYQVAVIDPYAKKTDQTIMLLM